MTIFAAFIDSESVVNGVLYSRPANALIKMHQKVKTELHHSAIVLVGVVVIP